MADTVDTSDTHQYLTDASGNRTHVVLTIEEYEELLDGLLDLQDLDIVRQRQVGPDDGYVSLCQLKERLKDEL